MTNHTLDTLISKRFYNINSILWGGEDELLGEIQKYSNLYHEAVQNYNTFKNSSNRIFSIQELDQIKKLFPFFNTQLSQHRSNEEGELVLCTSNTPLYVNYRNSCQYETNPEKAKELMGQYPSLKFDQIQFITPCAYSQEAIFIDKDIRLIDNTKDNFNRQGSIEQYLEYLNISPTENGYSTLYPFSTSKRGSHPHIHATVTPSRFSTGNICFGSHAFMRNYIEYLTTKQHVSPTEIMVNFIYDYLDWTQHVTCDDNYGHNSLVPIPHPTSTITSHLLNQYKTPTNREKLVKVLMVLSEFLTNNYYNYCPPHANFQIEEITKVYNTIIPILKSFQLVSDTDKDAGKDKVLNSAILSCLVAPESYLVLPDIYAKLYLLLLNQYYSIIPSMSATSIGLFREAMEYIPTTYKYSRKMFTSLLISPKSLLFKLYCAYHGINKFQENSPQANALNELTIILQNLHTPTKAVLEGKDPSNEK